MAERRASFPREALRGERSWFGRLALAMGLGGSGEPLILDTLPPDVVRVDVEFGRFARLVGYRLDPPKPSPGDRVRVSLYWTALRAMDEDYQVFVHGDAIDGQWSRLHADHFPALGRYPTDVWQVGEMVVDPFTLWIPGAYGAPQLGVHVGLYKGQHRVPITQSGRVPTGSDNRARAITLRFR